MNGFGLISRIGLGEPADAILTERNQRVGRFVESNKARAPDYYASPQLQAAVDVALTLGRPLLLTGEPGSGKTLAAFWLANKLALDDDAHFHEYQVRSDSRARDVCYDFDAISWFRQSQIRQTQIDKADFIEPRALGTAFGWRDRADDNKPHIVLIDEIDKAPRDFPNDLLLELDQMKFAIPETGEVIGPPKSRPIIVITSNSERRLPDPFLRRCVTYHIEIDPETVIEILKVRLMAYHRRGVAAQVDATLLTAGGAFWSGLRHLEGKLSRKPTIAEFWQWLVLASEYPEGHVDLKTVLAKGRGVEVAMLPRISTLFLPGDLQLVASG